MCVCVCECAWGGGGEGGKTVGNLKKRGSDDVVIDPNLNHVYF